MKSYYVYILANKKNGTLYVGITSDLAKRVWEHKNKVVEGFTKKYSVDKLVYFDEFDSPQDAIVREKQIKNWHRQWKINQIEKENPKWIDLYDSIVGSGS